MVEYQEQILDQTYAALADPTRRAILTRLLQQEARVTELAEPFAMSLNAVSKHLRVLEHAGLIRREVRGREHYLSADPDPLQHAAEWLNTYRQFWEQRLDRLETFLRQKKTNSDKKSKEEGMTARRPSTPPVIRITKLTSRDTRGCVRGMDRSE